ncbi:MAG TPA: hypothetical protein VJQ25_07120, partial [Nitrospira sp.]|nr:hypothetical protein [Nitrospira sp.]
MLHSTPLTPVDKAQVVQPFVQRVTEWTVEIAVENKFIVGRSNRHGITLPTWLDGVFPMGKVR